MLRGRTLLAGAALLVASLVGAANASAATEFGNDCAPSVAPTNTTFIQLTNLPGSPLPAVSPIAGILTQWRVNFPPSPGSGSLSLKILRPAGGRQYTVVDEATGTIVAGRNVFAARIPIAAGAILGLSGGSPLGALLCATEGGGTVGQFSGQPTIGSTNTYEEGSGAKVDVVGVVEPDADSDRYGDETQDKCPQSAAFQTECPKIKFNSFAVTGTGSVQILVTSDTPTPVTVSGSVKVGKSKLKLKARSRRVTPGGFAIFKLKFPAKLKASLRDLPPSRSLKLSVSSSVTDIAGRISTDKLKVKLKGQA
jgi:hypothetical protein